MLLSVSFLIKKGDLISMDTFNLLGKGELFPIVGREGVPEIKITEDPVTKAIFIDEKELVNSRGYVFAYGLGKIVIEADFVLIRLDSRLLQLDRQEYQDVVFDILSYAMTRVIYHGIGMKTGIKELQMEGSDNASLAEEVVPIEKLRELAKRLKGD